MDIQNVVNSGLQLRLAWGDSNTLTVLSKLKNKILGARLKAALAVNYEVIALYWHIGQQIMERQNWGSKLIETLSQDLQNAFPETLGFSVRYLQRMRQFATYYPDFKIMPQAVAQLPWGYISLLTYKVKDEAIRCWYEIQPSKKGWSRPTIERYTSPIIGPYNQNKDYR